VGTHKDTNRHGKRKVILGPASHVLCARLADKNEHWQKCTEFHISTKVIAIVPPSY